MFVQRLVPVIWISFPPKINDKKIKIQEYLKTCFLIQVFLAFKLQSPQGDVQFIQPVLKVRDTSSDILQTLKGTNEKLKLVDELWSKTYKMKDIGEKKRAQFALEVLRAHNKLREHHGTESLTLEKKVSNEVIIPCRGTYLTVVEGSYGRPKFPGSFHVEVTDV